VSIGLGFFIEALVAVLLVVTISYCVTLNKRLQRLKADEQTLKLTISELITATEIAERAVAGLKLTVQECDADLGQRLKTGAALSATLMRQVAAGEQVIDKLAQVAALGRTGQASADPVTPPNAAATAAAAHALAMRARLRSQSAAA
jgi:hypothetical protein